jgi:Tfp pilus assembly protein PilN
VATEPGVFTAVAAFTAVLKELAAVHENSLRAVDAGAEKEDEEQQTKLSIAQSILSNVDITSTNC